MKEKVKEKQDAYTALIDSRIDGEKIVISVKYSATKKMRRKLSL